MMSQPLKLYPCPLEKIENVGETYFILTLKRPVGFEFKAGQHVTFHLKDTQGTFQRSFSIASPPHQEQNLEFCIQTLTDGRGVAAFRSLTQGDLISLSPAQGNFQLIDPHRPLVFIAGGSGISPLRSFIKELLEGKGTAHPGLAPLKTHLIFGCRDASVFPFIKELQGLSQSHPSQFELLCFGEQGQSPGVSQGTVIDALNQNSYLLHPKSHYYLCGSPPMIKALQERLASEGIPSGHVIIEKY